MFKLVEVNNYNNSTNGKFYIYDNCEISKTLENNNIWEPHIHNIFDQYINKESIVLEAGCHIGSHTIKLGMISKKVYAFEPMPKSNFLLEMNIEINNLKNIILSNKGLSNINKITSFDWIPDGNPGSSGLSDNPMGRPNYYKEITENKIFVELISIDSLNLDKIDFIKIDVEGYEELVIDGAIETIKKFKPIIVLESWYNHYGGINFEFTKNKFIKLLNFGYKLYNIKGPDYIFLYN